MVRRSLRGQDTADHLAGTELFSESSCSGEGESDYCAVKTHAWINAENMLDSTMVGILVN